MRRVRGFTLIELMIVVLVIAVLASLAMSGYTKQIRKSRRAEARQALSDLALRQEKFRSNHTAYGTCNEVSGTDSTLTTNCANYNANLKYYTVAVTASSATGYTMTATGKTADQLKDSCGMFTFAMAGGVLSKTAANTGDPSCSP
jgi:type IV pilus assembly protein PilE